MNTTTNHPSVFRLQRPCLLIKGVFWCFLVLVFLLQVTLGLALAPQSDLASSAQNTYGSYTALTR